MSRKKGVTGFFGFLLIPLVAAILWSFYYSLDQLSLIRFLKIMIPLCLGIFIVIEFLLWAIFPRLAKSFKFGFYFGLFFLAPFYLYQIAFMGLGIISHFPIYVLYGIYLLSQIVCSVVCGLLVWAFENLLFRVKKSSNPGKMAFANLLLIIVCFFLLFPAFAKNRAAQADLVKKRVSYRAFKERELEQDPKHRVIVLGVDGADWEVIDPLLEEGLLPNFKRLMREGRWGTLESMQPMRSPVLWTTIFTGQSPEKHGVEDWIISYSKNRLVKAVWNILSEYELRTTLVNIPGTFPPEEVMGKEISGFPFPNQTMNTYGWLCSNKSLNTQYTPNKPLVMKLDPDGGYHGKITISDVLMDKYTETMKHRVMKSMWIEYATKDKIGEFYGTDLDIARFRWYENRDQIDILPIRGEDTPIVSLSEGEWSDFFMTQLEPGVVAVAKIKAVKLSRGDIILYVTPLFSPSERPRYQYTFPTALAEDITELFGQYTVEMTWMSAKDLIMVPTIVELQDSVENKKTEVGKALFDEAEWDLFIQVYSLTDRLQHPTWVFRYGDLTERVPDSLFNADEIKNLGEIAIKDAYVSADKWIGSILHGVNPRKDVVIVVSDHGFKRGVGRETDLGVHGLEGIYAIWGGPVKNVSRGDYKQNEGDKKSVQDITRNILYLMDLPVGNDMVGDVWLDLFDEKYTEDNPVESIDTYNVAEAIKGTQQQVDPTALEQLKGLGYIDGGNVEGN